jgi:prepilin-type processing-associated H-X9-DG protein
VGNRQLQENQPGPGSFPGDGVPRGIRPAQLQPGHLGAQRHPPGWIDPFAIFHGNVSTIGFADGHAELHKWVEATTIKAATDSANGRQAFNWAGGGSKNRDFRWVYDRYKHLAWKALP